MEDELGDLLHLDQQVCFPLYAATNLIQRLYRPLLAPLGLTYSQYLVMLVLWERETATVGELQACLHLDVGTLSPLLKRMERAGLVSRTRSPDDERRVLLSVTEHGRVLKREASEIPRALAARIGAGHADMLQLRALTQSLVATMARSLD